MAYCVWVFKLLTFIVCLVSRASGDPGSGCPSYGCLPSGTFSLSSDIPGTDNTGPPSVKWMSMVSSNTHKVSRLGCVTCQEGVVCATHSGYVGVDQLKGSLVWRYDNLTSPSLPILDIFGDVIGTNGRHLVKIDPNGKVEKPIIKIYYDLSPMFSIKVANDNLFLMTSYVSGELITYNTNGIVEASLTLNATVQMVNGSFVPVTQPEIRGFRAYLLTQFVPDTHQPANSKVLGLQRLYAVDLWARMVDRIHPVWYYNFEREACPQVLHEKPPGQSSAESPTSTVLVHNDTIFVSLAGPQAGCGDYPPGKTSDQQGTLWAFRDNGTNPEVLFKIPSPVYSLSLYDVTIGEGRPSWGTKKSGFPHYSQAKEYLDDGKHVSPKPSILWASNTTDIMGYNSRDGSLLYRIDAKQLLKVNSTCRITSKVMVTRSKDGQQERLVFAVSEVGNSTHTEHVHNTSVPYVIAVSVDRVSPHVQLLWTLAGKQGTQIVGQIPNMLVVPPGNQLTRKRGKGGKVYLNDGDEREGYDSEILPPRDQMRKIKAMKENGDDLNNGAVRDDDDVEVFLIATAISDTAQYSMAIGPK